MLFWLSAHASYYYSVNLQNVTDDKVSVSVTFSALSSATARFSFPATIPGTYATEDYGRLIEDFQVYGENGKPLTFKKEGNNTFVVSNANKAKKITYKVNDSFDADLKENKIFEPAGTNIEAGKCFVINHAGFFGFWEGTESEKIEVDFLKPRELYGVSALPCKETVETQLFTAKNYHQLVDCPILFAAPDTVNFYVNNTKVTLSVYAKSGHKMAKTFYKGLKSSMEAIAKFLPKLPVENYAFLIYVDDYTQMAAQMSGGLGLGDIIRLQKEMGGKGFGALEHGNSSMYYLPETGMAGLDAVEMLPATAVHEFMHILTPLTLHSQYIGNFNFVKPTMSKHLWLYEGITEYFAHLILFQGKEKNLRDYFDEMSGKIAAGNRFPIEKMSITEMSANVLDKKYHKQYNHVYDRGAVLGWLLDAEIIRLTDGKRNLKEVVLAMMAKYGADKSFNDDTFIKEWVAEVHPDLMNFMQTYIEGKQDWNLASLQNIGIQYNAIENVKVPLNPVKDNDVKTPLIELDGVTIEKVGEKEALGFKVGDRLEKEFYKKAFQNPDGTYLAAEETVQLPVLRDGKTIYLPVKVIYGDKPQTLRNTIRLNIQNEQQKRYFEKWSAGSM